MTFVARSFWALPPRNDRSTIWRLEWRLSVYAFCTLGAELRTVYAVYPARRLEPNILNVLAERRCQCGFLTAAIARASGSIGRAT